MVQKKPRAPSKRPPTPATDGAPPRRRGRPRAFEPDVALARALETFRDTGFAATSLDDLSAAMGINRPSLYSAFGDKRELFLKAYARYRAEVLERFARAFDPALTLRQSLQTIFATALDLYTAGHNGPQGCFTIMTAGSEAMADAEIRETVQGALGRTDKAIAGLFKRAIERGELPPDTDQELMVQLVSSMIVTLAVRSRARFPRAELEARCARLVDLVCKAG
ncbi:MAG: TetR/AcrR family transcriptional regulator [Xanthobacteraceae bacterium]